MHGTFKCLHCGNPLTVPAGAGRRPKYCGKRCRGAAFNERQLISCQRNLSLEGGRISSAPEGYPRKVFYWHVCGPEVDPLASYDVILEPDDYRIRNPEQPSPPSDWETRYARDETERWVARGRLTDEGG
jgi:hypothetical protein